MQREGGVAVLLPIRPGRVGLDGTQNRRCADLAIVPTLGLNSLRCGGSVL